MTPTQWAVFVTSICLFMFVTNVMQLTAAGNDNPLSTKGGVMLFVSWLLMAGLAIRLWFLVLAPILAPYW